MEKKILIGRFRLLSELQYLPFLPHFHLLQHFPPQFGPQIFSEFLTVGDQKRVPGTTKIRRQQRSIFILSLMKFYLFANFCVFLRSTPHFKAKKFFQNFFPSGGQRGPLEAPKSVENRKSIFSPLSYFWRARSQLNKRALCLSSKAIVPSQTPHWATWFLNI